MSLKKKILGILLILFSLSSIFTVMAAPNLFSSLKEPIYKEVFLDFEFLDQEKRAKALLFFGYVGCDNICLPSLMNLSKLYEEVDHKKVAFYFVNLQPKVNPQTVQAFAKAFHEEFNGVYLSQKKLDQIIVSLNVKVTPSLIDDYQLDHSAYLYLLKKQKASYDQVLIYPVKPFNKEQILNELNRT